MNVLNNLLNDKIILIVINYNQHFTHIFCFLSPVTKSSLNHLSKTRTPAPHSRRLPQKFAKKVAASTKKPLFEDTSEACLPEPIPVIQIRPQAQCSKYLSSMTVESSYVTIPSVAGEEDEIMV